MKRTPVFSYEDFRNSNGYVPTPQEVADIANAKLDELIADMPVVYGSWSGVYRHFGESYSDKHDSNNTHTARLFDVREIEKEECDHVPTKTVNADGWYPQCLNCGAKLKAKWEVCE